MPITKEEAQSMWDEVKANQVKLEACPRHDFPTPQPFQRQITCRRCGGWADGLAVRWYQRGLAHAVASAVAADEGREAP